MLIKRIANFATGRELHVDVPLSEISIAYRPQNFIADKIAPVVGVTKQSNLFREWLRQDTLRIPDTHRAPRTVAKRIEWGVTTKAYFAKNYALGTDIPLEDLDNADNDIDLIRNATEGVTNGLLMDYESRIAGVLTSTSNVGSSTTLSGTSQWTDDTNSTPVDDLETGKDAIHSTTGFEPNVLILGRAAYKALRRHPHILELLFPHGSGGKFARAEQLAELFELDKVLIGNQINNTADEGVTASYSNIWGGDAVLLYVNPNPGLLVPSYMYSFRWTPSDFPGAFAVQRSRKEGAGEQNIEIIEAGYYQDEKVIAPELGYLIKSAV